MSLRPFLALLALTLAARAWAQSATDLPLPELVRRVVLEHPDVRATEAALAAERADAQRQRRGPAEFTVRATGQQRRVSEAALPRERWTEGQLSLERPLRSGGKAAQDAAVAQAMESLAVLERADALHEAGRSLLRAWYDWLRERGAVMLWQEQAAAQQGLLDIAQRRVRAGDAARVEQRLQEAALAQARAALAAAQVREQVARATLAQSWPGLDLQAPPAPRPPSETDLPDRPDSAVLQELVERSHEWRLAQARAQLARERAGRTALDARPDPSAGVFIGSERGGAERLIGLSVSLPIGSTARSDATRAALARADEAWQRAEGVQRKVRAESAASWLSAQAALQAWHGAEEARRRYAETAAMLERGWQLGELAQGDVLAARRQLAEAALAELQARTEARHAAERLRLDLHDLWDFDDE